MGSAKIYKDNRTNRIGLDKEFIRIFDENRIYYGGNQVWFSDAYWKNIHDLGCGIIAAVNVYLYISGNRSLSKENYSILVEDFVKKYPFSRVLMTSFPGFSLGIAPFEINAYLKARLRAEGIPVHVKWVGTFSGSRKEELSKIEEMVSSDIPVVWAIHSQDKKPVKFYQYDTNKNAYIDDYVKFSDGTKGCQSCTSHYVVITGIQKAGERIMLEISSWGDKYYVDYAEYLMANESGSIINKCINNKFSSIVQIIKD